MIDPDKPSLTVVPAISQSGLTPSTVSKPALT
jgi:hypothetical protein